MANDCFFAVVLHHVVGDLSSRAALLPQVVGGGEDRVDEDGSAGEKVRLGSGFFCQEEFLKTDGVGPRNA